MISPVDLRTTSAPYAPSQVPFAPPAQAIAPSPSVSDGPGVIVSKRNPHTGVPSKIIAEQSSGDKINQALGYIRRIAPTLGFAPDAPPQYLPDPYIQTTRSGASVVHLHQHHHGVPVFQMARDVRFTPAGAIRDVTGDSVSIPPNFNVVPSMGVKDAFHSLLKFISKAEPSVNGQTDQFGEPLAAPDMSPYVSYQPKVIATFPGPSRQTVLEQGPFDRAPTGNLVLFNQHPQLRLGWRFLIYLGDSQGDYEIIVAAGKENPGEILYSVDVSNYMTVRGNVYLNNGASGRELVEFPRPLSDYPVQIASDPVPKPLPAPIPDFPRPWVSSDMTIGNSTLAVLGNSNISLTGTREGTDVLTFNPADSTGDDQKLLNIFYYCCYMHDFFYLLGFDEPAGNFQEINFSELGAGSDSVTAQAHSGAVFGTANMRTPPDGINPTMNMGLVTGTNRHTAFSADVVFHEFVHGVTTRSVGGRMNSQSLSAPQSRGMGEGWSDFFALTVQNFYRTTEQTTVGSWIVANSRGIRAFPYDDAFPDSFANLGRGRYVATAPHNIGEIWCATLMSLNRRFVERFGRERGYNLTWRLVFDGLQTTPANPSLLDARDEIYGALDDLLTAQGISPVDYDTAREDSRATFARYGMGPNASSNGASLFNIVPDFSP